MPSERDYLWQRQVCPNCDAEPTIFIGSRGGKSHRHGLGVECSIWRCATCTLIFPNPMPIPRRGLVQHYSIDPDIYFRDHQDGPKESALKGMLERTRQLIGNTGKLLDIGSGRGNTIKVALQLGWEVVGLEPSPEFAADIRKRFGLEVIESSIEDCSLKPGTFDAVVLSATLEHLYTPRATLTKISELLRPGGIAFMDVPNEDSLFCRVSNLYASRRKPRVSANLSPTFPPFHIFGFNPRSLSAMLARCGLSPVHSRFHQGWGKVPASASWKGRFEARAAELLIRASRGRSLCYQFEVWAQKPTDSAVPALTERLRP